MKKLIHLQANVLSAKHAIILTTKPILLQIQTELEKFLSTLHDISKLEPLFGLIVSSLVLYSVECITSMHLQMHIPSSGMLALAILQFLSSLDENKSGKPLYKNQFVLLET